MKQIYETSTSRVLRVRSLIARKDSRSNVEREQAADEIRTLDSDCTAELVRILRAMPMYRNRRTAVWFAVVIGLVLVFGETADQVSVFLSGIYALVFAGLIAALLVIKIYVIDGPVFAFCIYRSLTLVDDIQVLGPLLRAYSNRNWDPSVRSWVIGWQRYEEFYAAAAAALARLFSRVDAVTGLELSFNERCSMRIILFDTNTVLVKAVLGALEYVGDNRRSCGGFATHRRVLQRWDKS